MTVVRGLRAFITGTGTGIGKTYVTCQLVRAARAAGHRPVALKPLLSGYVAAEAEASDAGQILAALGQPVTEPAIAAIAPWRFAAPLSPDWAAACEGVTLTLGPIQDFCTAAARAAEVIFVEGAGGVMVPITADATMLDWMVGLGWTVILVAGSYLGTISHTLTAVAVLRQAGLRHAVVISQSAPPAPDFDLTVARLRARIAAPVLGLARDAAITRPMFAQLMAV